MKFGFAVIFERARIFGDVVHVPRYYDYIIFFSNINELNYTSKMSFQNNNNSNIERRSHNVVKKGKLCENMKNLQRKNEKKS